MQTLIFPHGLGDAVNCAHVLALYVKRGHRFRIVTPDDGRSEIVFRTVAETASSDTPGLKFSWVDGERCPIGQLARPWTYNKLAINISLPPLPDIGAPQDLWHELCETRIAIAPMLAGTSACEDARVFAGRLPRPIVLLHTMGYSYREFKSFSPEDALAIAERLQERTGGAVLVFDHYENIPRSRNRWVLRLQQIPVPLVFAIMLESDLLIGIDSGPLHASRMTPIPSIGLWPDLFDVVSDELKPWVDGYLFPSRFSLPTPGRINLVAERLAPLVAQLGPEWGARTSPLTPDAIADAAAESLATVRPVPGV